LGEIFSKLVGLVKTVSKSPSFSVPMNKFPLTTVAAVKRGLYSGMEVFVIVAIVLNVWFKTKTNIGVVTIISD